MMGAILTTTIKTPNDYKVELMTLLSKDPKNEPFILALNKLNVVLSDLVPLVAIDRFGSLHLNQRKYEQTSDNEKISLLKQEIDHMEYILNLKKKKYQIQE
jgi:hypothetical protein